MIHNQKVVHWFSAKLARGIQLLKAAGWTLVRIEGDQHHFKHEVNPAVITVPHPRRDLSIGVLKSIERISGLKLI